MASFRASGMAMERVGLEACSLTAWLHQGLTEAGIVAICIEARQAKAAMGAMPNKTDRNDARGIAQIMRAGWYRMVHVKTTSCRTWRALPTSRRLLTTIRRAVSNARQVRQDGVFTCTARYQPVRMICAIPRASLRSVLFGIAPIAAFAWRASMQIATIPPR